jgi:hypothetical protein
MKTYLALCVITLLICISSIEASDEKRLASDLLQNYTVEGRPIMNTTAAVNVDVKLMLNHIISLDQTTEIFRFTGWIHTEWTDESLTWDPAEYGGVAMAALPRNKIWTPDIILFNAVEAPQYFDEDRIMCHVSPSGYVVRVQPLTVGTSCETSEEDTAPSCSITMGSWVYSSNLLKINSPRDRIDASHYTQNNEFELFTTTAVQNEKAYECCPDTTYGNVKFTINLKRRPRKEDLDKKDINGSTRVVASSTVFFIIASLLLL